MKPTSMHYSKNSKGAKTVNLALRIGFVCGVTLLSQVAVMTRAASEPSMADQGHRSGLMAKITLPGGAIRTYKLEGVGCTASRCSRTILKGAPSDSIWLDTIAAIIETTEPAALFLMRDGTQKRVSLVGDFRVLYLRNESGAPEKLDLAKVKSVEFLPLTPTYSALNRRDPIPRGGQE